MSQKYFRHPETKRKALRQIMEIERLLAGKVMLNFRMWVPTEECAQMQPKVDAMTDAELQVKYPDLIRLSLGRDMKAEWEERNRIRRQHGKKPLPFDEDFTLTIHMEEHAGKKICFVGDGNNVCNSLLLIAPLLGMDMSVACPKGYEPDEEILKTAGEYADENNTEITVTDDIGVALENVDVVYTDVWVSMGDEAEAAQREKDFAPFQVNSDLMGLANPGAIFMHCLPAIRGQEVTAEVIDGPQSVIFDEAENRMHAQKAVLYYYMKD